MTTRANSSVAASPSPRPRSRSWDREDLQHCARTAQAMRGAGAMEQGQEQLEAARKALACAQSEVQSAQGGAKTAALPQQDEALSDSFVPSLGTEVSAADLAAWVLDQAQLKPALVSQDREPNAKKVPSPFSDGASDIMWGLVAAHLESAAAGKAAMEREVLALRQELQELRSSQGAKAAAEASSRILQGEERQRQALQADGQQKGAADQRLRLLQRENGLLKLQLAAAEDEKEALEARVCEADEERYVLKANHQNELARLEVQMDALQEQQQAWEAQREALEGELMHAKRDIKAQEMKVAVELQAQEALREKLQDMVLSAAGAANSALDLAVQKREVADEAEELKRDLVLAKAEIGRLLDAQRVLVGQDWVGQAFGRWTSGRC